MLISKIIASIILLVTLSACSFLDGSSKTPTPVFVPGSLPPLEDRSNFQVLVKIPEEGDRNSRILCDDIRYCILEAVYFSKKFGKYRNKIFVQASTNFHNGMGSVIFDLDNGTILKELPSDKTIRITKGIVPEEGWIELNDIHTDQRVCQVGFLADLRRIVYSSQVMFSPCDELYFIAIQTDDETRLTVLSLQPLSTKRYLENFEIEDMLKFLQNPTHSLKADWLTLRLSRRIN
jgi:hypothetical protein